VLDSKDKQDLNGEYVLVIPVCRGERFQEHALKYAARVKVRGVLEDLKVSEIIILSSVVELIYPSVNDIQAKEETTKDDCAQDPSVSHKRIFGQVLPEYVQGQHMASNGEVGQGDNDVKLI